METVRPVPPFLPDKKPEVLGDRGGKLVPRRPTNVPRLRPTAAGLGNLGNTCFLNAVLQCITHTVPLLQKLHFPSHPYRCSGNRGGVAGEIGRFCTLCALRQHIDLCIRERGCIIKPNGFVNNLCNISSSFSRYQQEDAHEFLHCLLESLHSSCLAPHSSDNTLQKDSFIKKIFGGRLRSQVQCCDCGHRSDTYEPLLDLSLEIEDAESLEDALESFTTVEKIEDPEIKFTCEGCKAQVSVQKQFTLDQVPPVIALHLKRFKSNGYIADKIDKFVKYPLDLDLKPFHSNPEVEGELKYELYAAVMHQGISSLYGHYYSFVRPSPDLWYIMDDEKVYSVNEESALSQNAYILFYMKRGTPWFSSLIEGKKIDKYLNFGNMASPVSIVELVEADQNSSSDSEDNSNNSAETRRTDEKLSSSGDTPSDTDKNGSCSLGTSVCIVNEIEASQAHRAVNGHTAAPPLKPSHAYSDTDVNVAMNDVACLLRASQCNEINRTQTDAPVSSCTAAPLCRPSSSSSDCAVNEVRGDHTASPPGVTESSTPENEGNLVGSAVKGDKITVPFTPKQSSMDRFYDEIWEEDEKVDSSKLLLNNQAGKSAGRVDDRKLAALKRCLMPMPSSRRIAFEQLILQPGSRPSSAEHQKRKRKLHLDGDNTPCRPSNTSPTSGSSLPSSVLQKLVAQDDSQLIDTIDFNQSGKGN
uniref:Ubiquitin carboxyl-terminal hydrolase 21 n=1 Tax=Anthurium amnicola TaxID=1678845 RepID=A0A1D1Z570_9ARAE